MRGLALRAVVRMAFKKKHTEIGNDDICTMRAKVLGVVAFSDANHKPEAAGMPRFRSDKGIFEYDGASRWSFEPSGRFQEHNRRQQPTLLSIVTQNTLLMTGQMVICGKADACAIRLSCTTTSHL